VFRLEAAITDWEWDTDQIVQAWTYNGVVPGPEIRVTEGDKIRVIVDNKLPESTAVHWHGLIVPNSQDGVPFITQPPIKPGHCRRRKMPAACWIPPGAVALIASAGIHHNGGMT
jgi:FtsP/CotA-like multicopper oxidase with cupredoxin domain